MGNTTISSFRPIVGLGNLPITTDISQNADKIFQFGLYVKSNSATDSVKIYEYTTDGTDRNETRVVMVGVQFPIIKQLSLLP